MFSKEYFRYLFRSQKYLLLLILIVTLLNVLGTSLRGLSLLIQCLMAVGLSFLMPFLVFYHVHDKKAVDTFFSIPVSRKSLLFTGVLFCILTVYIPLAIGITGHGINEKLGSMIPVLLIEMLLASAAVTVFNSTLYLVANSVVDGMVMMGAYSVFPLTVYITINSFFHNFVPGVSRMAETDTIRFLSPLYMSGELLLIGADEKRVVYSSLIGLAVVLVLFSCLLYRSYVNRAAERAGSHSTGFFSYPLVINLYLIVCLFLIATGYGTGYRNISEFLQDSLILYILLFAAFIAAHFVYRRKLYFHYILPVVFVAFTIISLLFTGLCRDSEAFGLARRYEKAADKDCVTMNLWYDETGDRELLSYLAEQTGKPTDYCNMMITVGDQPYHMLSMSQETSDLIEKLRSQAITDFYAPENEGMSGNMYIAYRKDGGDYSYNYLLYKEPTFAELKTLAKDKAVEIVMNTDFGEYRMKEDGTLEVISSWDILE